MPEPYELDWVRLPLEEAHNVRELGGYPVAGGGQTHYHRFLRSDALGSLTPSDVTFLHNYGVRLVLDLRDSDEAQNYPDVSLGDDVQIENVPMFDFDIADKKALAERFADTPPTYEFFYDIILSKKEQIARCFYLIAEAPEDACVLFHCAVGKDRTGVLAMLLMALAGCDKWDCVSNYVQTRVNLMRHTWYAAYWESDDERSSMNDSPAHALEFSWNVVEKAGGVMAFLHDCGIDYEKLAAVRARLIG